MIKKNMKNNLLLLIFLLLITDYIGQKNNIISGTITDKLTGEPLPFATIGLETHFIGTVSNEQGFFKLIVPDSIKADSIYFNYLGYEPLRLPLRGSVFKISLAKRTYLLQEVIVRDFSPIDYIKWAVQKIDQNYPSEEFITYAYFKEHIMENNVSVIGNESFFKTHYAFRKDSCITQNQLLLYKSTADKNHHENDLIQINNLFGGPELILQAGNIYNLEPFLDSNNFKKFNYFFDESGPNNLIVINYHSKKAIDHVKLRGKIYIDRNSMAITSIKYTGDFKIPLIYKPILFAAGIGIRNTKLAITKNYHHIKTLWYPDNTQIQINLDAEKKHLFRANEVFNLELNQIFVINRTLINHIKEIEPSLRFDPKKAFPDQVYNTENISWDEVNTLK